MKPKYLLGLSLVLAAVAVVIINGFANNNSYFMTVSELRGQTPEVQSQNLRISGAVLGDSIHYDVATLHIEFDIVDSSDQIGVQQPLRIAYDGPKPDLLQADAQAIIEGRLGADGVFHADTLLLKCPTRYQERFPGQVEGS